MACDCLSPWPDPPEMTQSPSGDTATQKTLPWWPVNVCTTVPVATSHTLRVSSQDAGGGGQGGGSGKPKGLNPKPYI